MKLNDKIRDRQIAFFFRKQSSIAFELGLLYFVQAKRKHARKKILDACQRSIHWLKKAGISIQRQIVRLSPMGQLEELERILVSNKKILGHNIDARLI